jgi:hypothetical protein
VSKNKLGCINLPLSGHLFPGCDLPTGMQIVARGRPEAAHFCFRTSRCGATSKQSRLVDEDVIVHKLLQELDVAGYEIVKKPGNAGFTFETSGGAGRFTLP